MLYYQMPSYQNYHINLMKDDVILLVDVSNRNTLNIYP